MPGSMVLGCRVGYVCMEVGLGDCICGYVCLCVRAVLSVEVSDVQA